MIGKARPKHCARLLLWRHRIRRCCWRREILRKLAAKTRRVSSFSAARSRWSQKRIPEADAALADLIANTSVTGAYQIAEAYGYRNDKDHAFEWLECARRQRDACLSGLRADTLLRNLHDDPRWDAV